MAAPADDAVSCSVFVAVRSRPFNGTERTAKAKSCLQFYDRNSVRIAAPKSQSGGGGDTKNFTFDKAYPIGTSQDTVFQDLGLPVVNACLSGYNACIFAYGQTGSGKSFSMMGPRDAAHIIQSNATAAGEADGDEGDEGDDAAATTPTTIEAPPPTMDEMRGIIPRVLEKVFDECAQRLKENAQEIARTQHLPPAEREPVLAVTITASYLEIYQEKVRCLLNPETGVDLKVRLDKEKGAYADGLQEVQIKSVMEALGLLARGNETRAVASTGMNDQSSRSHSIFSFTVEQSRTTEGEDGPTASKVSSKVNLVDLAGSERAKATKAEGQRLKEGANINKSLTVLGLVISGLADQAKGKGKSSAGFIPYRDSKLTFLLKENLGGNSKTFMLSALSPADIYYEETLSTLRYADRAKAIVTKAFVNEDAKDKVIRQLQEQLAKARAATTASPGADAALQAQEQQRQRATWPAMMNWEAGRNWTLERVRPGGKFVIGRSQEAVAAKIGPDADKADVCALLIGEEDEEDMAPVHAVVETSTETGATLHVLCGDEFITTVDGEDVMDGEHKLTHGQAVGFGEVCLLKFNDPRQRPPDPARRRERARTMAPLTARGPRTTNLNMTFGSTVNERTAQSADDASSSSSSSAGSPSPSVPPISLPASGTASLSSTLRPSVPKLALGGGGSPSAAATSSNGSPQAAKPALAGSQPRNPALTARIATPRSVAVSLGGALNGGSAARDELVALYHHTFVLVGETGSGKTAFRAVLGKEFGFFDRKREPTTAPTLGFDIERQTRVGGTTKCDLTLLELSGNRAFAPVAWMVPHSRVTFMIFFRLNGAYADGRRCDLHYFQQYMDLIRSCSPTKETSVVLIGTFRDAVDMSDTEVADTLLAMQKEIVDHWVAVEPNPDKRPTIRGRFAVSCRDRTALSCVAGASRSESSSGAPSGSLTARLFGSSGSRDGAAGSSSGIDSHIKKMTDMQQWMVTHTLLRCKDDTTFVRGLIPQRVLNMLKRVEEKRRHGRFALKGTEYKELAKSCDSRYSTNKEDLLQHTQLLHSWLHLFHHYRHTSLKRHVFVDVEWVFRVITTLCCAGACAQLGAFTAETNDGRPRTSWQGFAAAYANSRFPFDVVEVRNADRLHLLSTGVVTSEVARALFHMVLSEKQYATDEVSVPLDLLTQFDLVFPASKQLIMMPDVALDEAEPETETLRSMPGTWTTQQEVLQKPLKIHAMTDATSGSTTSTPRKGEASSQPIVIVPSFFVRPAPEPITVFVPELLSCAGPTVCFSLHSIPTLFFPRLLTRLARFGKGIYFGQSGYWADAAWLVASDCSRVLLRLVSRSLFVTFHDHDDANQMVVEAIRNQTAGGASGLATARPTSHDADPQASTLDDECYEAYLASTLNATGLSPEDREARYLAIRRGMVMRRESDLQTSLRQDIRDLIMEAPGASYVERDRLPLREGGKWREIESRFATTMHQSQAQFLRVRDLLAAHATRGDGEVDEDDEDDEDPEIPTDKQVSAQSLELHELLLAEADASASMSSAFYLDARAAVERFTVNRFLSNDGMDSVQGFLGDIASARHMLAASEASRYHLFLERDAAEDRGEEVDDDDHTQKLRALRRQREMAAQAEATALDNLVDTFASPLL